MVYKKITLIGTSGQDFENAVDDAITRAEMTLDNIEWVEIVEQNVQIGGLNDREYQVEAEVAFEVEPDDYASST
jgi:flavin-binding protein dodecin